MSHLTAFSFSNNTQLHGQDLRVRLRCQAAQHIALEPYFHETDPFVLADARASLGELVTSAGMVEFQGSYGGRVVTIGWDWAELKCGDVVPILNGGPRTNLQLVDPKGYDMTCPAHDMALWELVSTLRWEHVRSRHACQGLVSDSSAHTPM